MYLLSGYLRFYKELWECQRGGQCQVLLPHFIDEEIEAQRNQVIHSVMKLAKGPGTQILGLSSYPVVLPESDLCANLCTYHSGGMLPHKQQTLSVFPCHCKWDGAYIVSGGGRGKWVFREPVLFLALFPIFLLWILSKQKDEKQMNCHGTWFQKDSPNGGTFFHLPCFILPPYK